MNPTRDAVPETVLRMRGVDLGYGREPVVRGLDLELRRGELVALLGPNGSGKSTVVRGILGLNRRTAGTIEVLGARRSGRRSSRIGYVPQRHTVVGGVPTTVREVVAAGLVSPRRWRPSTRADRSAVDAALAAVDLTEHARRPVAELSGGQQRRALIARALARGSDVLLMDEPMAGVDLESQSMLASTIQELVDRGTTILLVAHELGPLAGVVDRAVVLRHGVVVHDGPPSGPVVAAATGHSGDHHLDPEQPAGSAGGDSSGTLQTPRTVWGG